MFELSDKLVKELKDSDVIIISAPIYNYGPPATLKAWSDLAARIGETFRFKPNGRREGLLKNKHAYLVAILSLLYFYICECLTNSENHQSFCNVFQALELIVYLHKVVLQSSYMKT